jgi:hypothetical protein
MVHLPSARVNPFFCEAARWQDGASADCKSESFFPRSCKVARWWSEETRRGKVPRGC